MLLPALTGSGASLFVIVRSAVATAATVVVVVALLFVVFVSKSVVLAVAVLVMTVDGGVAAATCTTIWNVAEPAGPRSAAVQVIVPAPPTAGFEQENGVPAVCEFDTNVVFGGTASVSETLFAPAVPLFITAIV
jgi:hypothetical protein